MKGSLKVKVVFVLYIMVVLKVIIFKYPIATLLEIASTWERGVILEGLDTANFTLFKTIRMYVEYAYKLNSFENLVGNVVVFLPFGFLLPFLKQSCRQLSMLLLYAFLFIVGIEVFQLFSAFGAFDVDDILLNCVGAMLGWCFYKLWQILKSKKSCKI